MKRPEIPGPVLTAGPQRPRTLIKRARPPKQHIDRVQRRYTQARCSSIDRRRGGESGALCRLSMTTSVERWLRSRHVERQHRNRTAATACFSRAATTGANKRRWCDGGSEPVERLEMLGHAVALVGFEAVARTILRQRAHQPVARHLGDDRGRRDRHHQPVAADHRLAVAADVDPVAAVDEHVFGRFRQRTAPRAPAPTARRAGYCRGRSAPVDPKATATAAVAQISSNSSSRRSGRQPFGIVDALGDALRDRARRRRPPPDPPADRARPRRSRPPARCRA